MLIDAIRPPDERRSGTQACRSTVRGPVGVGAVAKLLPRRPLVWRRPGAARARAISQARDGDHRKSWDGQHARKESSLVVNPPIAGGKALAAAAPARCDDLGGDAHGRLLRRSRTEVEADRRGQPRQFVRTKAD